MRHLDITNDICPMTWVRVKLAAEALDDGAELEVHLKGSEPLKNLPRSAREEGHEVLALDEGADGTHVLTLRIHHADGAR